MDLLIKNARIVDWSVDFLGDIYIKDGKIAEIGRDIIKEAETIDAKGMILMPAFIDLHCHFRDPGYTYKEDIGTGSKAAVRGGFTTVNLMANTNPVCSNMDTVNYVLEKGKQEALIDIHQCMSITRNLEGKDVSHLDELEAESGLVKLLSDDGKGVADSKIMMQAMIKAEKLGLIIMSHAESPDLSDVDMRLAENTMTWRDITLAKYTKCKLHLAHVSTKEAMEYVIEAKEAGNKITCEVTPHHIGLTDEINYRVNPPLRKEDDVEFLIEAIKRGYVDCIATDHAPHTAEDKAKGAPGISGIETAFAICYTKLVEEGHIGLSRLSDLMSKRPAEIMGIEKGKFQIGYEGDMVLVDIDTPYEIDVEKFKSKGKNSPFHGYKVKGTVLCTIKAGQVVYREEEFGL
ncbi:dihydroorotase [Clostridium thermarum]|uniref:dihydroorotase n=1 Tax=Clostridium thermarum TaxID=1716543 RepID=UPI00111F959B|nr:dihydroorotase [Clostridium thermarum]